MTPPIAPACRSVAACLLALLLAACASRSPASRNVAGAVEPCVGASVAVVSPRTSQVPGNPEATRFVRQLDSPDFVERSKAAEQLVAMGSGALPALGAVGDQWLAGPGDTTVSSTQPVVQAIFAAADVEVVQTQLAAPWPSIRREAANELGRRGRWSPVPDLIVRLDDADSGVRAASVASLRRLTNNFFGYRAKARPASRRRATSRWRSWWTLEGRVKTEREEPGVARRGIRSPR